MLNLPNVLTIVRILLVPPLVVVLLTQFDGKEWWGLGLFLLAALMDFLDGWFARRRQQITRLGTLLDPAADKILISAAFISLVELSPHVVPSWPVVVIVAREFAVSTLRSFAAAESLVIPALRGHAPFDEMDSEALSFLAARLRLAYYPRGQVIIGPQSGPAERLYIIKQGSVRGTGGGADVVLGEGEAEDALPSLGMLVAYAAVSGLAIGVAIGTAQGFVLRRAGIEAPGLRIRTALVWAAAMLVSFLGAGLLSAEEYDFGSLALGLMTGAVMGAVVGSGTAFGDG